MDFKSFIKNTWNKTKSAVSGVANSFTSSLVPHLASGVANEIFGETLEDKQRYALEQMEQQNKYNVENYERMRDDQLMYSDPAFIRQRLEKAGLSASLALANGGMSSPISATVGSSSTPGGISGSLRPGNAINLAESMARIRNMDADTESKKTETDYNQKAMQTRLDILSEEKLSKSYANTIARIDALYKEDITKASLDKLQKEIDSIAFDMANRKDLTDIERQKLGGYLESLSHQYALWQSQIALNQAKTETEGTQQTLNESLTRLNDAKSWSQEFENFKWQNNGTIKPGMNVLQAVTALIADLPSNLSKSFKDIQSIGNYIDNQFNNLKNIVIKDVNSFINDVNEIASSTNKLDSFIRMLEKNVAKFAN